MSKIKELSNQKFNSWQVLNEYQINKHGKALWLCICDCGIKKHVLGSDLTSGKSKRCHACGTIEANKEKRLVPLTDTFWGKIRDGAKKRNLDFNLTKEEAYALFLAQNGKCKFTGLELTFNSSTVKTDGTASLDRINSKLGYSIDNIQWVHKKINQIKMDLPDNEFVFLCHLIAENNIKPSNFDCYCITPKSTRYDKRRDNCVCGNKKIKKAKQCKSCYMS